MLCFNLRSAMDFYEAKTGVHLTYIMLGQMSGISPDTLKSIATRGSYNTTLSNIERLSFALNINPLDYLEWRPNGKRD